MASREKRQFKLAIAVGGEQVNLVRLKSLERLSKHFHIALDIISSFAVIDFAPHLGKPASVSLYQDDVLLRHFNGIVVDSENIEQGLDRSHIFRLTLRPRAYVHEQGRRFRIFQNKSARTIIKTVLDECQIMHCLDDVSGADEERKYCVQYGESDFSFVSRLMEEEGVHYYYQHTESEHILTMCDIPGKHRKAPASPFRYRPSTESISNLDAQGRFESGDMAFIHEWRERVETVGEALVNLTDYDFTRAEAPLSAEARFQSEVAGEEANIPVDYYDYPGRFYEKRVGIDHSETLMASRTANRRTYTGRSQNCSLECGTNFTLDFPGVERFNGDYLLTRCQHTIGAQHYHSGMGQSIESSVDFEAVPADADWRPLPLTPRPYVRGPETAIVTGPTNEEIYCDEWGRVKVQFHWDQEGKKDEESSCWIRVSQTGGLGNIILPRVGHEVLVDFINGDPDRPLIVGRVFNSAHPPHYKLPEHKTRATWRTKTYREKQPLNAAMALDSNDPGANEMRFEDRAGQEEIYLHAQRDMNNRIQSNETHHVGHNQSTRIGNEQELEVGANRTKTVAASESNTIGTNQSTSIGANRDLTVGASETIAVTQSSTETVGTSQSLTVGGTRSHTVGASETVTVGAARSVTVGGMLNVTVGAGINITCGASNILITPAGIIVNSPMIFTNGTLGAVHKGGAGMVILSPFGGIIK